MFLVSAGQCKVTDIVQSRLPVVDTLEVQQFKRTVQDYVV